MIRTPKVKENRVFRHVPRQMADGRWVCKGGHFLGPRCAFIATEYADAVTHATQFGATPPDMPRYA